MYDAWRGGWYAGQPKRTWLAYDAEHFTGVEVDATFYRQQRPETYAAWASQVPPDFRFAVRGHRYLSHNKKLLDVGEPLRRTREQAEGLGEKLGPVLWQLPPRVRVNVERVRAFGEDLRANWPTARHVLEFRNESWFTAEVADALAEYGIANCISDAETWPRWDAVTTDLVYVRLHGRPWTYASRYEDDALDAWASLCERWLGEGRTVHVYFDNDAHGHAPYDAVRLLQRLRAGVGVAYVA
jgi:uncharacterized protein YecE (DUF72 family)